MAIRSFEQVSEIYGKKDIPSQLLMERCQSLFKNPPPVDWNGVYTRTSK